MQERIANKFAVREIFLATLNFRIATGNKTNVLYLIQSAVIALELDITPSLSQV
jgi:hypothetical protein